MKLSGSFILCKVFSVKMDGFKTWWNRASLKRKRNDDELEEEFLRRKRKRVKVAEEETLAVSAYITSLSAIIMNKKTRKRKSPDKNRELGKIWWTNGYLDWSVEEFVKRIRIQRGTFNMILDEMYDKLVLQPTNLKPLPTSPDRQLALTIYRLAHGCSYSTCDLFGISESTACKFFNRVCRLLVSSLYDRYVRMPETDDEWEAEVRGFLENYEFPCFGAWDGFHVYITTKLKNYYSFKKRYTMTNLGLVGYNKRFLYAGVGAPGSTHDATLLRKSSIYREILDGGCIPERKIKLGDQGEIPLVSIGDSAFPRYPWLIKGYNENTRDQKQRYFNKRLCGARVVTENCYGMAKGRFGILYKQTECRIFNLKYIIMACIMLHNLCISVKDPCKPRWKLSVKQLGLIRKPMRRSENKLDSNLNRMKISNWLWLDH